MSDLTLDAAARISTEADVLRSLMPDRMWQRSTRSGRTTTVGAYEMALSLPDAAHALALLRAYAEAADLGDDGTWSISAVPSTGGPADSRRFATVNFGTVEAFYVWFSTVTGLVTVWGLRVAGELNAPSQHLVEVHPGRHLLRGRQPGRSPPPPQGPCGRRGRADDPVQSAFQAPGRLAQPLPGCLREPPGERPTADRCSCDPGQGGDRAPLYRARRPSAAAPAPPARDGATSL